MSNSSLATLQVPAYEGNYTKGREGKQIKKITIHHMAGRLTAQRCGELFQRPGREGSSHYGIGYDGQIAQYVDEENTAWSDSNWESNTTSVTIETSNDSSGGDWPINDITLQSLIRLVADIAVRNSLGLLIKGQNLTWHRMYAATACPGPYLLSKMDYICEEANKIISGDNDIITTITPVDIVYQAYDGAWLEEVSDYDINNSDTGFAGVIGNPMSGLYVSASVGNVYYKVHIKGGEWLPEVKNKEDYAGIFGRPIDAVMIKSDATSLIYQVHCEEKGWLDAVSGYNENDADQGYAGWMGYAIDAIAIKANDIITTTIVEKPKVEEPKKQLYRIRLTWEDSRSQIGAYSNLNSAISICQSNSNTLGVIYKVFDIDGNIVYEAKIQEKEEEIIDNTPVYDLDYPNKVYIIDRSIQRTDEECGRAIKCILANNAGFDINIAKAFFKLGPKYGIDPMMAISQSILETGWFKYNGSAVEPEHHNYCGLGVTKNGITGGIFDTIEDGVTAQYQHLFAYGCKDKLDEEILDPRFSLVTRGIAPCWQNLSGRWAVPGWDKNSYSCPKEAMMDGQTYGQKIIAICEKVKNTQVGVDELEGWFAVPAIPSEPEVMPPSEPEKPVVEGNQSESQPTPVEPTNPPAANKSFWQEVLEILINFLRRLFSK